MKTDDTMPTIKSVAEFKKFIHGMTPDELSKLPADKIPENIPASFISSLPVASRKPIEDLVFSRNIKQLQVCLLYTSPSPRDRTRSRMPSSA